MESPCAGAEVGLNRALQNSLADLERLGGAAHAGGQVEAGQLKVDLSLFGSGVDLPLRRGQELAGAGDRLVALGAVVDEVEIFKPAAMQSSQRESSIEPVGVVGRNGRPRRLGVLEVERLQLSLPQQPA